MRKLFDFEFISMLDDNKIKVKINNRYFIRTIKKSVNDDSRYILVNKREYYL